MSTWRQFGVFVGIMLASLLLLRSLLLPGLPVGHDLELEMVRLFAHRTALMEQGWPLLASMLYGGYGSPIFMFYPPLFLWMTSIFSFIVFDLTIAVKLSIIVLATISGWYFYKLLLKNISDKLISFLGALLWMGIPYKFVEVFERNSFAEYASMMLLPVVFYALERYFTESSLSRSGKLFLVFTVSLFLLSHNVMVLLGTLFLLPFSLWGWKYHSRKIIPCMSLIFLSLLVTAWFWLPILAYREFMNPQELLVGKFLLERNFINFFSLHTFGNFLYLSPVILVLPFLNVLAFYRHRGVYLQTMGGAFAFVSALLAYGLLFSWSEWFWDIFSFYKIAQFPWRLLAYISFFFLWNSGTVLYMLLPKKTITILLVCAVSVSFFMITFRYGYWDMRKFMLEATRIESQMVSTTVGNEYLPPHVKIPGGVSNKKFQKNASTYEYCTYVKKNELLTLPLFYFPYWEVRVNEKVVQNTKNSEGLVGYRASEDGESCISATLQVPFWQKIGILLAMLGCIGMLYMYKKSSP